MGFEISKAHSLPSKLGLSLPPPCGEGISSQLPTQCLPARCHAFHHGHDLSTFCNLEFQTKRFLGRLPWSGSLVTIAKYLRHIASVP